jgi:hypothetical protein
MSGHTLSRLVRGAAATAVLALMAAPAMAQTRTDASRTEAAAPHAFRGHVAPARRDVTLVGYWHHGWHDGRFGWWWFDRGWYFYDRPVYPYPYPPAVVVQPVPVPVPVAPPAPPATGLPPAQFWYYCDDPAGYYPYVTTCNTQFRPVAPQPR